MQINVAQFLKSPQGTSRVVAIDDMYDDGTGPVPVRGELTFTSIDQRILVQGRLTIELQFVCGRCLKPFPCKLNMDIEEEYQPTVDISTGTHLPPPDESGAFTIDEHHVLDLTEAIRQYKETTIPMKPLCREDCAGICSTCGKDLNEGQCGCPAEVIDPRWAELLKLKNKGRK